MNAETGGDWQGLEPPGMLPEEDGEAKGRIPGRPWNEEILLKGRLRPGSKKPTDLFPFAMSFQLPLS